MAKKEPPVHIGAGVTDPRALAYQKQLMERKYNVPVAEGPTPPIPPLDRPFQKDMTMADQGRAYQRMAQAEQGGGIIAPQPSGPPLLPGDVLPEEAKSDPAFQQGTGSMLAVNQPAMAVKYGVIRNGHRLAAQQLSTGRGGLSEATIKGLQALTSAQSAPKVDQEALDRKDADREAAKTSAGEAARLANESRSDNIDPISDEERKKFYGRMDEFDWKQIREALMKDILNNEDQRKIIEERCEPMDVMDLVNYERVCQIVPVVPNRFEPEFQSTTGTEELAIKRLIMQEAKSLSVGDEYLLDKYSMMGIALGVKAINKKPLPTHLNAKGEFDEDLFLAKFNRVLDLPFQMLASLGVNYFWFVSRVRLLFRAEKLKNG